MTVKLRPLDDAAAPAWDRFVHDFPAATFFHLSPWASVIGRVFGHRTHFMMAEQDGAVVGVLPLVHMKTLLFGDVLSSTPFCVYGGPVGTPEAVAALTAHAIALQARLGSPALEFRRIDAVDEGFLGREALYFTFRKPIAFAGDAEKDLTRNVPVKRRSEIRKGFKRGATSVANRDVATMHHIYAHSVRTLGTPVFPRRYFQALLDAFGTEATSIVTILHEGAAVSSALSFHFRDQVLPYYVGGTPGSRACAGNDVMFYEVMRRAGVERGAKLYDFGRSKQGTGAFDFKRYWGFEPEPLNYAYHLAPGASIPENNPNNPKYRAFIALWKKLPLPITKLLGPPLVRGLG
jgi:FemAB-related protein (PEP-CTERM system-associated)